MNYDQPRQRSDGRWDMTSRNDDLIHAIGYCVGNHADPRAWNWELMYPSAIFGEYRQRAKDEHIARYDRFAAKYHEDGHATEVEASDCYREHRLDQGFRTGATSTDPRPCFRSPQDALPDRVGSCDWSGPALTRELVLEGGFGVWHVCPAHQTRETYELILGQAGRVYASAHS